MTFIHTNPSHRHTYTKKNFRQKFCLFKNAYCEIVRRGAVLCACLCWAAKTLSSKSPVVKSSFQNVLSFSSFFFFSLPFSQAETIGLLQETVSVAQTSVVRP